MSYASASTSNSTFILMAVASELAGAIIGKGGSTLNEIRRASECKVTVDSAEIFDRERLVSITGASTHHVYEALDGILSALFASDKQVPGIAVLFHPKARGPLIGRGGANIKEIRSSSGATVTVHNDSAMNFNNELCRCDIQGDAEAMRTAARQVAGILFEHVPPSVANDSAQRRPGALRAPSYGAIGTASTASPSRVTMDMVVPKRFIGNIIGRSGKYVNTVRQQFNVEVKVDDTRDVVFGQTQDPAAVLSVTGPREHVWLACGKCVKNLLFGSNVEEEIHSVTIMLNARAVPRIIGKAGSHISTIRSSSQASITVNQPKQSDDEDLAGVENAQAEIVIEGTERAIIGARMMIESTERSPPQQSGGYRSDTGMSMGMQMPFVPGMPFVGARAGGGAIGQGLPNTITLDLYVPKQLTGLIIGRGGKSINNVRAATKTEIKISDGVGVVDQATGEELASLSVQSHDSATAWIAAGQLMEFIHSAKPANSSLGDEQAEEILQISKDQVGIVIGKSGAKIAMIRESSACKITLEQDEDSDFATIILQGQPRQIIAARCLIRTRETIHKINGETQVTQVHSTHYGH